MLAGLFSSNGIKWPFMFLTLLLPLRAHAVSSPVPLETPQVHEVWGSHAYCWANETIFNLIWTTYGGNDWYPVTVMIGVDGRGVDNLQTLFANATSNNKKLYPILRLTAQGGENWSKIDPVAAATMLNAVTPTGFPGPIYVSFGNETHMANEWDGATDPSPEYGDFFRTFASAMAGNSNYVVGHGAVNLSFPPGEAGEGWSDEEGPGDRAERFYSSVAGKGAGSMSGSRVLFSNPYELGSVPFPDDPGIPGTAYRAGTILNIPEHIDIDRHYNSQQGGSNSPNIWMEFGLHPGQSISARKAFLENAYASYPDGNYKGLNPKAITPMLMSDVEAITPMLMSDVEKYIVVYKDAGGISYIQCAGTSCGDEICAGGSARNNPSTPPPVINELPNPENPTGADEEGPACVPGLSKLKIKGTLKSSRLFTYDPVNPDKLIRVPEQDAKNPHRRDYPIVTNQKVAGAVVAVYKSQKVPDPPDLPPGVKMVNFTGKKDGKIVGKAVPDFRTKADGVFEIETFVTCEEVWDGAKDGWKQYLAIMCLDNPDGNGVRMMLKDLYSFHLRPGVTDAVLDLRDINIDCDVVPPLSGVLGASTSADGADVLAASSSSLLSAPDDLNYVFRDKDTFLACSGTPKLTEQLPLTGYSHRAGDHRLTFRDEYVPEDTNDTPIIGDLIMLFKERLLSWFFNELFGQAPFKGRTEGRLSLQRVMCDMRKIYGTTPGFFRGVKEGFLHIPKYYSKGAPAGVETFNNYEEKQEPFNCEMLRRSALAIGEEGYEDFNAQTSGGFFNNLGIPFGGLIRKTDGSIDPYLSGDVARYLAANKSTDPATGLAVCKDDSGNLHYLGEFMPPEGYCGDLDNSGSVAGARAINGGEMPCPERFSCGDYNGNGINASEGEVDCASVRVQNEDLSGYGRPGYYKFDVRYFPQFALDVKYTRTLGKEDNYRIFENNDDKSDWCGRGVTDGGWFDRREGSEGASRPDTRAECHNKGQTSQAFLGQLSVRRPSTINGVSFFTTFHTLSADKDATYPHHMVMSPPQFVDSSDSAEIVKRSVSQAVTVVKSEDIGGVSRIGSLDSLCTCSHVEDGTNSADSELGNCFHDAQAIGDIAPDPRAPLNSFDSTQDYKLEHEGGDYGLFDEDSEPNRVAADYDWGQIKVSKLAEKGEKVAGDKSPTDTHYAQDVATSVIEMLARAAHNLIEIIQCGVLNVGGANNTTGYLICGRKVNMIGKASIWIPSKVRSDYMKNWYVVGEVLTAPFTLLPDIDSVCEEDSSYTKAYEFNSTLGDSPDSKGKESYEGESFENSLAYLVNSAKPPAFEGDYAACHTVRGWQVTEKGYASQDKMLISVECSDDGSNCWVSGEGYDSGRALISHSSDSGLTWSDWSEGGGFVHGLGIDRVGRVPIAVGQLGRVYRNVGNSWSYNQDILYKYFPPDENYTSYLYDVAVGQWGALATGTGYVFYAPYGSNTWRAIAEPNDGSYNGYTVGCKNRDWPDYCVYKSYYKDSERTDPNWCDTDPRTPLPDCNAPNACWNGQGEWQNLPRCCGEDDPSVPCCCVGNVSNQDPDRNNQTSYCPDGVEGGAGTPCWIWGDSSIWGVDCNDVGDCIIAGQKSPKVWWASAGSDFSKMRNWNKVLTSNVSGMGHNRGVSFPGPDVAYVVGGSEKNASGMGGYIIKSENKGRTWTAVLQQSDSTPSLAGIDCYDSLHCVAVGGKGTVLFTENGGLRWEAWGTGTLWPNDPVIEEAKSTDVRFLDVAYPNQRTIVIVGYKSDGSAGVIYTLGEREVCD